MRPHCFRCLSVAAFFLATLALPALAQSVPGNARTARPAASRQAAAKPVLPDPDLLDGSSYEAEKRSEYGMLAEFEMGEASENQNQGDRVGSGGGQEGGQAEEEGQGGGGSAQRPGQAEAADAAAGGGASEKPEQTDPNAQADGIQVADLKVPEGQQTAAQSEVPGSDKPKEIQIGDATLQIRTLPSTPNVVGTQQQQKGSHNQQYEKGAAAVQQTGNSQNRGVEKGRVMPPGL